MSCPVDSRSGFNNGHCASRAQRGFGMIEAMVSLAVLAVALLGLAGLQIAGARANNNAYLQSQAAMLAQDMFERIRGNPNGGYAIALGAGPLGANSQCEGTAENCDATRLARYDLNFWKCALGRWSDNDICVNRLIQGQLPSGDGSIAVAGNVYTMTIQWFDPADNQIKSFAFSATI